MGLVWLTALSVGLVLALAPPRTVGVHARVGGVIFLAAFGIGFQVAEAEDLSGPSIGSQITTSTIITLLALSVPVATIVARQRRRSE